MKQKEIFKNKNEKISDTEDKMRESLSNGISKTRK